VKGDEGRGLKRNQRFIKPVIVLRDQTGVTNNETVSSFNIETVSEIVVSE